MLALNFICSVYAIKLEFQKVVSRSQKRIHRGFCRYPIAGHGLGCRVGVYVSRFFMPVLAIGIEGLTFVSDPCRGAGINLHD